jgi:hypothetical protein
VSNVRLTCLDIAAARPELPTPCWRSPTIARMLPLYASSLVGWEPAPLVWACYSSFSVLYPTDPGLETLVNFTTLPIPVASERS